MKPLQPILDMLERADNPRARVIEAMKPKVAQAASQSLDPWQIQMMNEIYNNL